MRWQQAITFAFGLGLVAALGNVSVARAQGQTITLQLHPENNSGISGTATLADIGGGRTRVEINLVGAGSEPRPAHVHDRTCDEMDPTPKMLIGLVTNGTLTAEIGASLGQLTSSPQAIHVHKSQQEIPFHVACADISLADRPAQMGGMAGQMGGATGSMGGRTSTLPRAGDAGPPIGTAIGWSGLGLALAAAGYALRRWARR
jgi:hypothetical protein